MIRYSQGKLGLLFALSLKGSVFPKALVIASPCACLSGVLHFFVREYTSYFDGWEDSSTRNSMLAGFATILGFLIVFRSQQAYLRWWEGGGLLMQMRGEWFNAYSSLMAFMSAVPDKQNDVHSFQQQLVRLFSLLHCAALQQVTTMEQPWFETMDMFGFETQSMFHLQNAHDKCEVALQWIQKLIVQHDALGSIAVAPPILSRVYQQLANGMVNLNNARKITELPYPFPLAQVTVFMLIFHWCSTLYFSVVYIPGPISAFCTSFIVVFSLWSINYISLELEVPFGIGLNDLPLDLMQEDFNKSLTQLLRPSFQNPPAYSDAIHQDRTSLHSEELDAENEVGTSKSEAELRHRDTEHIEISYVKSLNLARSGQRMMNHTKSREDAFGKERRFGVRQGSLTSSFPLEQHAQYSPEDHLEQTVHSPPSDPRTTLVFTSADLVYTDIRPSIQPDLQPTASASLGPPSLPAARKLWDGVHLSARRARNGCAPEIVGSQNLGTRSSDL